VGADRQISHLEELFTGTKSVGAGHLHSGVGGPRAQSWDLRVTVSSTGGIALADPHTDLLTRLNNRALVLFSAHVEWPEEAHGFSERAIPGVSVRSPPGLGFRSVVLLLGGRHVFLLEERGGVDVAARGLDGSRG
jgi:hypothetical protein